MFLHRLNLIPFFQGNDNSGGGNSDELDVDKTIELLSDDDNSNDEDAPLDLKPEKDKVPPKEKVEDLEDDEVKEKKEKTEDEDDEEEKDELDELEEELQETPEDKLELMTPARRKDILAKYPKLFKEFPHLERAYYRDQEFSQRFPSVKDADEALKSAETLNKFEQDLLKGDTTNILKIVKEHDQNAYNKIVDEYLITLANVDKDAHIHVVGNVIKDTIVAMVQEAQNSDNEVLKNAAAILNQFVFGTSKFQPKTQLSREPKPEDNSKERELEARERKILSESFVRTREEINNRIDNVLTKTIEQHIDPKNTMTDYIKDKAMEDALKTVQTFIQRDSRFKNLLDRLWQNAFKNSFSKDSTDKIRQAYLSRARTLLPSAIKKARNDALKGMGKRIKEDSEEPEFSDKKKGPIPPGRSTTPSNSGHKGKTDKERAKEIPAGMSALDYLMQD